MLPSNISFKDLLFRGELDTVFAMRRNKQGPVGQYGMGFSSSDIDVDNSMEIRPKTEHTTPSYGPEGIINSNSEYATFSELLGLDSQLPSWYELEALQAIMQSQFAPRTLGEALFFGTLQNKRFSPMHPLQRYDYLQMLRDSMKLSPDPTDSNRLHGDSRYKQKDHPTRFGVDEPNTEVITDRITGQAADMADQEILNQFLNTLRNPW